MYVLNLLYYIYNTSHIPIWMRITKCRFVFFLVFDDIDALWCILVIFALINYSNINTEVVIYTVYRNKKRDKIEKCSLI